MIDCTQLPGRLREICEHRSGLPREIEDAYIEMWSKQHPQKPQSLDCVHRGEHIGWVPCPTCENKTVNLKLFACPLHSQCVMRYEDVGKVRGCGACGSRLEKTAE